MSQVLTESGINDVMIAPVTKFIKNPTLAFWTIGIVMMIISWFFWPSPAVALLGAVLLPAALQAGLPALDVAIAMNLFGHGIALSGDFIIQAAPKLTADAAGIPVGDVITASIPLVITMGIVTTVTAFFLLRRDMKRGLLKQEEHEIILPVQAMSEDLLTGGQKKFFAVLIPIAFLLDVVAMSMLKLQGGDATALVGGTAVFILLILSLVAHKQKKSPPLH